MTSDFDIVVIGKGLVGSSAAKYLCENHKKVAVIGTCEPIDNDTALVFASHYDQARVQRLIGKDATWTKLNVDSVQQYKKIETESGLQFHSGVGCLYVNPYGKDEYIKNLRGLAQPFHLPYRLFENIVDIDFKGLAFPKNSVGVYEPGPAGYLNPRLLIKAQLEIFRKLKGFDITGTVIDLTINQDKTFTLSTENGGTYSAKNVLVATGCFLNCFNILSHKLKLETKSEVVLLVKVEEENVSLYANLPSLLYEINEDDTEGIYVIQPVKYPDGNYYVKIGCNSPYDIFFDDLKQIQDWFRKGNSDTFAPKLISAVKKILPSLNADNVITRKCVISRTQHGRPYIGETSVEGIFLAGGCNGYSAMCSDAIGNVAAHLILKGKLPEGYSPDAFKIRYDENTRGSEPKKSVV